MHGLKTLNMVYTVHGSICMLSKDKGNMGMIYSNFRRGFTSGEGKRWVERCDFVSHNVYRVWHRVCV